MVRKIGAFVLSTIVLVVLVWYVASAIQQVYNYYSVYKPVLADEAQWSVQQVGSDRYVLHANYLYTVDDKAYSGSGHLKQVEYRNEHVADRQRAQREEETLKVFYSPRQPQKSSIDRTFPAKAMVYAGILMGVFGYFAGLILWMKRSSWKVKMKE